MTFLQGRIKAQLLATLEGDFKIVFFSFTSLPGRLLKGFLFLSGRQLLCNALTPFDTGHRLPVRRNRPAFPRRRLPSLRRRWVEWRLLCSETTPPAAAGDNSGGHLGEGSLQHGRNTGGGGRTRGGATGRRPKTWRCRSLTPNAGKGSSGRRRLLLLVVLLLQASLQVSEIIFWFCARE